MEKIDKKTIKQVCEHHKVDHVLVSEDGHIFLPKAINHAKNHAHTSGNKYVKVSANGEELKGEEAASKTVPENKNLSRKEPTLKQMNKKQLLLIVEDLVAKKGVNAPNSSSTNKELVGWIESTKQLEDVSSSSPVEEGAEENVNEQVQD